MWFMFVSFIFSSFSLISKFFYINLFFNTSLILFTSLFIYTPASFIFNSFLYTYRYSNTSLFLVIEISILLLGKLDHPHNCRVFEVTISSLQVSCLPGGDGGMEQTFLLQVRVDAQIHSSIPVYIATLQYFHIYY